MTNPMLAELDEVVRLMEAATPGEWLTEYRKTPRGYAQEVFDAAGDTIATMAWHAVPLNETTTTTDREANAHLIAGLVNFLRTHHATLADMAKRLEAAEKGVTATDFATTMHNLGLSVATYARVDHEARRIARERAATQEGEG